MAYVVLITAPPLADKAMDLLEARNTKIETMRLTATPDDVRTTIRELNPDGIISRTAVISRAAIDAAGRLKAISKHGAGVDNIDIQAATDRGIPVARTGGANAQSVAEHAAAMTLALARHLLPIDESMRHGEWPRSEFIGTELHGLTLGLLGYGEIARRFAAIAAGFGVNIMAFSPSLSLTSPPRGVRAAASLEELFRVADVVSLHCALNEETRGMVNANLLALMKPQALLINTARGAIVKQNDLVAALETGRLAGAGLDTFAGEPLAADHVLRRLPNVVLTPHIAGSTRAAMQRVAVQAVENLFDLLDGKPVAPDVLVNSGKLEFRCG